MGIKFKMLLMTMVIVFTGTTFAGCDTWSTNYSGSGSSFHNGIYTTDNSDDPNFNDPSSGDLGGDEYLVDESTAYDFLEGVKFAYDGKAHKIETLNDESRFNAVYYEVSQYLEKYNTIDCSTFASNNSVLGVDATYISRVVWLYNYVCQYKTLARIILTKIAGMYGFGIGSDYYQNESLYGLLYYDECDIEDNGDYKTNKNAINAGVYELSSSITVDNAFKGLGEATYGDEPNTVNFNTQDTIDLELDLELPVNVYHFIMHTTEDIVFQFTTDNPYYDPDNIVNQQTIENPDYDPDDATSSQTISNPEYIEGHLLGMSEIILVGTVDENGSVNYALTTETTTSTEEAPANDFIQAYIDAYENYLALKLLESHLKTDNIYTDEDYVNVTDSLLLALYEEWSAQIGQLGFSETFYDVIGNEYDTLTEFTQVVYEYVVGQDVLSLDANADISRALESNIKSIVSDSLYALVAYEQDGYLVFEYVNGQDLFATVYNIEWRDYTAEELFGSSTTEDEENSNNLISLNADDPLSYTGGPDLSTDEEYEDDVVFLPDEIVYSVVIMLKPDYEPVVMQSILLMMLAPYSELDVELAFRYVKNGEEQIFSLVDYSIKEEQTSEDEYVINSTFTGHLDQYDGEELSMDVADNYIFALEDYNTPELNTIRNQEILLEQFQNNLASNYFQSLNVALGANRYAYSEDLQMYYYNEQAENCDYIEMNFHTSVISEGEALMRLRLAFYAVYFETLSSLQEQANATD